MVSALAAACALWMATSARGATAEDVTWIQFSALPRQEDIEYFLRRLLESRSADEEPAPEQRYSEELCVGPRMYRVELPLDFVLGKLPGPPGDGGLNQRDFQVICGQERVTALDRHCPGPRLYKLGNCYYPTGRPVPFSDHKPVSTFGRGFDPLTQVDVPTLPRGCGGAECLCTADKRSSETHLYLVQFQELPTSETDICQAGDENCLNQSARGSDWTEFLPGDAYLLRRTPIQAEGLLAGSRVRAVRYVSPDWKVDPAIFARDEPEDVHGAYDHGGTPIYHDEHAATGAEPEFPFEVEVRFGSQTDATMQKATLLSAGSAAASKSGQSPCCTPPLEPICDSGPQAAIQRIRVSSCKQLQELRELAAVDSLRRAPEVALRNATTSWVIQTDHEGERLLFDLDLRGEEQVIGLIDDRVDPRHCFFADAPRVRTGKFLSYDSSEGVPPRVSPGHHGTFVAGILAGQDYAALDSVHNGQAPEAQLRFFDVGDIAGWGGKCSNLYPVLVDLYDRRFSPARVFSNSWGDDTTCSYSSLAEDADRFLWQREDAVVVFATSNAKTIRTPENAKNVVATGASAQADLQDRHGAGGAGPTLDGRRKPDLVAPGCWVYSALAETPCDIGSSERFHGAPLSCSTSWSAPAVAGAAALVRQYFTRGYFPSGFESFDHRCEPSGALLKAMLLNGTVDMVDVPEGNNLYPSSLEGWGRLLLDDSLFAGARRRTWLWDLRHRNGLRQGEPFTRFVWVGAGEPLKVTLVWADPPAVSTGKLVNDLDLIVVRRPLFWPFWPRIFYLGNDFGATESVPRNSSGVYRDRRNNVEQILVNRPRVGFYEIRVEARRIQVGHLGRPLRSEKRQGFALVVSGALPMPAHRPGGDCSVP